MQVVTPARGAGSSPLARGPLSALWLTSITNGLIPARAGTTTVFDIYSQNDRAHPRSRGDHNTGAGGVKAPGGSSPLARGPPPNPSQGRTFPGLIPARAGTTFINNIHLRVLRAHPRSRGDHRLLSGIWDWREGSSPLARGPLIKTVTDIIGSGLIPARAGTTFTCTIPGVPGRAHPRSRGDHRVRD